jgi:hypothetical protein
MTIVQFRVPDEMAGIAFEHCADLARVEDLEVSSVDGARVIRESDELCHCGRKLREYHWKPTGLHVQRCPVHGSGGDAA